MFPHYFVIVVVAEITSQDSRVVVKNSNIFRNITIRMNSFELVPQLEEKVSVYIQKKYKFNYSACIINSAVRFIVLPIPKSR